MLMQLYAKNQNCSERQFWRKVEKLQFEPTLAPFGPTTTKQDF